MKVTLQQIKDRVEKFLQDKGVKCSADSVKPTCSLAKGNVVSVCALAPEHSTHPIVIPIGVLFPGTDGLIFIQNTTLPYTTSLNPVGVMLSEATTDAAGFLILKYPRHTIDLAPDIGEDMELLGFNYTASSGDVSTPGVLSTNLLYGYSRVIIPEKEED